jgi:signal transduction histidine kinase
VSTVWLLAAVAATGYGGLGGLAVMAVRRARAAARLAAREHHARDIHDNVVQGLTQVNWALEAGAYDLARDAARVALADAQEMVGGLLEEHPDGHAVGPGSLRRGEASGHAA